MARRQHPGPASPALPLGRRAALLGVAGGLAWLVTGCTPGGPASPTASPSATASTVPTPTASASPTSPGETPSTEPSTDPSPSPLETGDRTRVRLALEKTEAMLAGLLALRRPGSAAGLIELHTTHRAALLTMLDEPDRPLPEATQPRLTRPEIPLREAGLQAELVSASLTAEDGLVARLLASMSAGVAQRLAQLPSSTPGGPSGGPSAGSSPTGAAT